MFLQMTDEMVYSSRRGVICVRNGAVASSQPLATEIGLGEQTNA